MALGSEPAFGAGTFLGGKTKAGQKIRESLGEPIGDTHVTVSGKGTVSIPAVSPVATSVAPTKSVSPVTSSGNAKVQTQTYTNPSASPYTGGRLKI